MGHLPGSVSQSARGLTQMRSSPGTAKRSWPVSLSPLHPFRSDAVQPGAHRNQSLKWSDTENLSQSDTACWAQMESGQSEAVRFTQSDTPCQAEMPSSRYGQSVSQLGQADRSRVLVHQASMKSMFSQTQPERLRLSGGDGVRGQLDTVGRSDAACQ